MSRKASTPITLLVDPASPTDATHKGYVDAQDAKRLPLLTPTGMSTPGTAAAGQLILADTTAGGAFTVTLPTLSASGTDGWVIEVKNIGTAILTLAAASGNTIGSLGATSIPLRLTDQSTTLQSYGTIWILHYGYLSLTALDGRYAMATRQVSAGTGLTGGGDLTADRSLTVSYGTAAGTAAQGNDARLSDTRTPSDGTVTDAKVSASAAIAESKLNLTSDAAVATPSRRTIGTGALQAAAGNHTHGTYAPLASPSFTGSPTTAADPTTALGLATKQYVDTAHPSCRYVAPSGGQTISTATDTPLNLSGTAVRTTTLVTQATRGAGHQFTLNRAGIWAVTAGYRLTATSASGEAFIGLRDDSNVTIAADNKPFGSVNPTMLVHVTDYFPSGQVLYVDVYQTSGSSKSLDTGGPWCYFVAVWLGY